MRIVELFLLSLSLLASGQTSPPLTTLIQEFKTCHVFWQQFEIGKKLVKIHDRAILDQLEPYLNDDDRHVRANVAFLFAAYRDQRGFDIIARILEDRSPRPQGQGIPGGGWSLSAQITADRYYAAHLLGDLKDSRAVPILVALLHDPEVNHIIPWSLGNIGDKSAVPSLIQTLDDPDPDMRVLAIDALETLKAKDALPRLRQLVNDQNWIHFDGLGTVAESAARAISTLEVLP